MLSARSASTIGALFSSRSAATRVMPVSPDELERWLEQQARELRAEAPHGTVRLSRLTQGRPAVDLVVGWLVELELAEGEPLLAGHRLADALRDMRLLGLQPTLLARAACGRTEEQRDRPRHRGARGPTLRRRRRVARLASGAL